MNDPRNPYSPPASHVADQDERTIATDAGRFIPYGRALSPGRGAGWIGDAWRLLKAQPGMWAAALILLLVAWIVLSFIPLLNIFMQVLTPFAYAGIAMAADQQQRTGRFELDALVAGFKKQPASLLAIGGITILASIVFVVILALFIGTEVFRLVMSGAKADPSMLLNARFWLAFLVAMALVVPVGFAAYLAPQLVVLQNQPALVAMKMSLIGCVKNILPGIVFLICGILLVIVASIPLGLGLLIAIPILVITNYTVYRDIFVEENPS